MGAGLKMENGDIAFKCNFATIDDPSLIISPPEAIQEGTQDANQAGVHTSTGTSIRMPTVLRRRCDRNFSEWGQSLCQAISQIKLKDDPSVEVLNT